jgi:hypothetical protein
MEILAAVNATEIELDGVVDEATGFRYIGKATKTFDGHWLCLAQVGSALCRVELHVRPTVHVDHDGGDEDDRSSLP